MINHMKEEVPRVTMFIENCMDSLSVLIEIQSKLDGVVYSFDYYDSIQVYEYDKGMWGKIITDKRLVLVDFLTADEKNAVRTVFANIDSTIAFIHISSESIDILFNETNRGKNVTSLIITTNDPSRLASYNDYYAEWIDQVWSYEICYWQRG